jgi:hypothetical protein
MRIRIGFGAATCALFIVVPALAQPAAETTSAEAPAATAGPTEVTEEPVPPPEGGPAAATEPEPLPVVEPAATPVEVEEETQRGFEFAVRVAYAIPLGDAIEDVSLSDAVSGGIPIQLDLGYRVDNHLFIGGYGTYLIGFEGDVCDNIDCDSPSGMRVGGELIYNILPVTHSFSPWIGAGIGYEWLWQSVAGIDSTLRGMEFFNAQIGVDFRVGRYMRVGPYGLFALGQYSKASSDDVTVDIDNKGTHEWIHLGVKATFGAWGAN